MNTKDFFSNLWNGFFKKKTKKLGSGRFNSAFLIQEPVIINDYEAFWVIKQPKRFQGQRIMLNDSSRAARKWAEINPTFPIHVEQPFFWVVPFLGNKTPSDALIQESIIDIYRRTGNIIADGCKADNFVEFKEKAVCVDMDLALRRNSIESENYYENTVRHQVFNDFMKQEEEKGEYPLTIQTIKTLFFLEDCLSINDFVYQEISPWVLKHLETFQQNHIQISKVALKILVILERQNQLDVETEKFLKPEILLSLNEEHLLLDIDDLKGCLSNLHNKLYPEECITDHEFTSVRDSHSSLESIDSPLKIGSYGPERFFMGLNSPSQESKSYASSFSP